MKLFNSLKASLPVAALLMVLVGCGQQEAAETNGATPAAPEPGIAGTYRGVITEEMIEMVNTQIEAMPEDMQEELREQVAEQMATVEDIYIEVRGDNTFTFSYGSDGAIEGTWTQDEAVLTLTASRVKEGDEDWRDANEIESMPQSLNYNEEESTLSMGPAGQELVLKKE